MLTGGYLSVCLNAVIVFWILKIELKKCVMILSKLPEISPEINLFRRSDIYAKITFASLVFLSVGKVATAQTGDAELAKQAPNFILIYTDDQRWDALGIVQKELGDKARFPWFTTPNLDRMSEEGARFPNAFVVCSLSSPSRAAFLSGKYNHMNGIINNRTPFLDSLQTYPAIMGNAGYKTAYIGKWHMGTQKGKRPGFDYSASFISQGIYENCPFEINGVTVPTNGWVDDVSTDMAIRYIKENKDVPFSMVLGYKTSHVVCEPPSRSARVFTGSIITPAVTDNFLAPFRAEGIDPDRFRGKIDTQSDEMILNYFRTIKAIDDNIGRLLNALDSLGLDKRTVVVFAGDNGFSHGEHGMTNKRTAYEESIRIPLLIRYPDRIKPGTLIDEMVLNIDIAPTFLDLAGLDVPIYMQGQSMATLFRGNAKNWRKAFIYEYFYERKFATPTTLAVRTASAKLINYPGNEKWSELFDLEKDPYETRNLYDDPSASKLRKKMTAEFRKQTKKIDFAWPVLEDKPVIDENGKYVKDWNSN